MESSQIIGIIAAICTTIAFVPQVLQIIKTKDTKSISLEMYIIFSIGVISWLIYGIMIKEFPIIAANSITLVLAITVLGYKIKYK